jgi:hypothetical protein
LFSTTFGMASRRSSTTRRVPSRSLDSSTTFEMPRTLPVVGQLGDLHGERVAVDLVGQLGGDQLGAAAPGLRGTSSTSTTARMRTLPRPVR